MKVNHRSGVTLAMCYRLYGICTKGLKGNEREISTLHMVLYRLWYLYLFI